MSIKQFSLFDSKETESYIYHNGIKILTDGTVETKSTRDVSQDGNTSEDTLKQTWNISNDGKSCTLCKIKFDKLEEQRAHFKLDWHKYNVKQMLIQKDTVKEDVFEEIISGDVSSISGSDSESDSDESSQSRTNPLMTVSLFQSSITENQENFRVEKSKPKIYFVNNSGKYMSVYREVLFPAKELITSVEEVECKIENLLKENVWSILMTGGGHFAGAVFSGNNLVVRKTFHRYTVRAKRGTAQGMRDNKQGGHQPKSAGASLRRYNEAALVQDIQNLLESWSEHVDRCDKIFIRVPNNYKCIFFEGKKPPFKKGDVRIRTIPFAARRATFKELEKVHRKLSTVEVHENYLQNVCNKTSENSASRSERRPQTDLIHASDDLNEETETYVIHASDDSKEETETNLIHASDNLKEETEQVEKVNEDEEEHETSNVETSIKNNQKDQRSEKLSKKDRIKVTKNKESQVVPNIWTELYKVVISCGDIKETKHFLAEKHYQESKRVILKQKENYPEDFPNGDETEEMVKYVECVDLVDILNQTFHDYGDETVLHLASRLGQTDNVRTLLEAGADPTIKDPKNRVPFNVAKDKETRSEFRRFMASHPSKYDYKKAQIPSPLTTEMEEEKNRKLAEKKKAQAKVRKQRQKEKKAEEKLKEEENLKIEQEERGRNWFQNLSDREKRAVAAERRSGNICFNCSRSLEGLVPFERLSNKYCSTECVQKHRQMMEAVVK